MEAKIDEKHGNPYVIGSSTTLTIIFWVTNFGTDPAYLPELKIPLKGERFSKLPDYCQVSNFDSFFELSKFWITFYFTNIGKYKTKFCIFTL